MKRFALVKLFLVALGLMSSAPAMAQEEVSSYLRVTPVGYRVGERGEVVGERVSEVVTISPDADVSVVSSNGLSLIVTAKAGFGYRLVSWQQFTVDPLSNRELIPTALDTPDPTSFEINYSPDNPWIYLVAVLALDNERTLTLGKSPFGEGTIGTNYGTYACQKGDVFKLAAVPKHDDKTGFDHSTFRRWSDGETSYRRTIRVYSNETYVAEFIPNCWKVTFDPQGGAVVPTTKMVTCDATYGRLPTPSRVGHRFDVWSTLNADGRKDREVTSDSLVEAIGDHTLFANWVVEQFEISAQSKDGQKGNGTVSGAGLYDYGSEAMLTAEPSEDSKFSGWDDGEGRNPRFVIVRTNATYFALFDLKTYTVTFTYRDAAGEVAKLQYEDVTHGSGVTPPAPETCDQWPGHTFAGWSTADYTAVESDLTVAALYDVETYAIRTQTTGPGSGTVTGDGDYPLGASVTLRATADAGSEFVKWTDGATNASRTFLVESNALYVAEFTNASYRVTFKFNDTNGVYQTVSTNVPYGAAAVAPEVPEWPGHTFAGWSTEEYLKVLRDLTVEARYDTTLYKVRVETTGDGSGYVSGVGNYALGDNVTLRAYPDSGSAFVQWGDGYTGASRMFVVESNVTYTAEFAKAGYQVIFKYRDTNGVWLAETTNNVASGTEAYAPTNLPVWAGHTFIGWSTEDYRKVTRDLTVEARYEEVKEGYFKVRVETIGTGSGTVSGAGDYPDGANVTLKAYPDTGSVFVKWSGDSLTNDVTTPSFMFVITNDVFLSAEFTNATYQVSFTYRTADGGSETYTTNGVAYGTGAIPPTIPEWRGHAFSGWSTMDYLKVTRDLTVEARYDQAECTIQVEVTGNGEVRGGGSYSYNKFVTLIAIPGEGSSFVRWQDGVTETNRSFYATTNATYGALFQIATNTVTFVYTNGTEETNVTQLVEWGRNATPPESSEYQKVGYTFSGWDQDYTAVKKNMEIHANYTPIEYTVIYDPDGKTVTDNEKDETFYTKGHTQTYDVPFRLPIDSAYHNYCVGNNLIGWTNSVNGVANSYEPGQWVSNLTTNAKEEVRFYAVWTNALVVTFTNSTNGAVAKQNVRSGGTVDKPTAENTRDVCPNLTDNVAYWSETEGGSEFDFNTSITNSMTLYACTNGSDYGTRFLRALGGDDNSLIDAGFSFVSNDDDGWKVNANCLSCSNTDKMFCISNTVEQTLEIEASYSGGVPVLWSGEGKWVNVTNNNGIIEVGDRQAIKFKTFFFYSTGKVEEFRLIMKKGTK